MATKPTNKFDLVYKDMRAKYPNFVKSAKMTYQEWWRQLLVKLYDPLKIQQDFIDELLTTFEGFKGYTGYDDVEAFLKQNYGDNVIFVASSNSDPRVVKVLESLKLLKYFHKVYLSYDIEVTKPNLEFFNYIIDDLLENCESLKGVDRKDLMFNVWHIGDELTNDLEACFRAGWNGILIDRKDEYESLANQIDETDLAKIKIKTDFSNTNSTNEDNTILKLDEKRYVVKNFNQVSKIIGLTN